MASAKHQRQAAVAANQLQLDNQYETRRYVEGTTDKGLTALGAGIDAAKNDLQRYLPSAQFALQAGWDQSVQSIGDSNAAARDEIRTGIAGLDPYAAAGRSATDMYGNSLGLNRAAGNAAAVDAFHAGPGYQWQVDQATEAAARKAASLGIGGSGNTLDAITRLGSNLADQEYSNWQNRLQGLGQQGQAAATTQLGGYQNIGSIDQQEGKDIASLATGLGQNQANLFTGMGSALAGLDSGQGQSTLSAYQGLGNTIASVNTNATNQMGANLMSAGQASDAAANANSGLPLQLLGLGAKLGTANLGGGSTLFGKLFS